MERWQVYKELDKSSSKCCNRDMNMPSQSVETGELLAEATRGKLHLWENEQDSEPKMFPLFGFRKRFYLMPLLSTPCACWLTEGNSWPVSFRIGCSQDKHSSTQSMSTNRTHRRVFTPVTSDRCLVGGRYSGKLWAPLPFSFPNDSSFAQGNCFHSTE